MTAGVGIMVLFAVWVALFMVRGSLIPAIVGRGVLPGSDDCVLCACETHTHG